jgi:hypothetical protein
MGADGLIKADFIFFGVCLALIAQAVVVWRIEHRRTDGF